MNLDIFGVDVFGGFSISIEQNSRGKTGRVDPACWNSVEDKRPGLSEAQGVYVFTTRDRKGNHTPWYVGETTNFKNRISSRRNVKLLKKIKDRDNDDLQFFLIAALSDENKLMKQKVQPKQPQTIKHLEQILIAMAMGKNSKIINKAISIDETYVELRKNLGIHDIDAISKSLKKMKCLDVVRKKGLKNALGM